VVFKPITGIFDFASKTTLGIKSTMSFFDPQPNTQPIRFPRAFYGKTLCYREYSINDAEVINLLKNIEKDNQLKYADINFVQSIYCSQPVQNHPSGSPALLVLSVDFIILWSYQKCKIEWDIETSKIKKLISQNTSLFIEVSAKGQNKVAWRVLIIDFL